MVDVTDIAGDPPAASTDVAGGDRSPSRGRVDLGLISVVVLGAFLRFWHLGSQSIWYDEYVTTLDVSHSLIGMLRDVLPFREGSPPLYFVLEWFWLPIVGRGDGAVRSLSAIAGIATVPMVYLVAAELQQSRRIARIVAFLVAVNPFLVWYSQEARPYALVAFIGTITIYCWSRALRLGRTRDFVWWGIAAAAAMCTHYYAFFLILPEGAWLLYQRRSQLKQFLIGCIPLAVVALPLARLAMRQRGENQAWIMDFPLSLRSAEMGRHFLLGPQEPFDSLWPLGLVLVAVAAGLVIWRSDDRERSGAVTMAVLGVVGFVLVFVAVGFGADYVLGRNLIASFIPLLVALAIGLGVRRAGWLGIATTAVLCLAWTGVVLYNAQLDADRQKPNWRAAADVMAEGGNQRVAVVGSYLGDPLLRYLDGSKKLEKKRRKLPVRRIDLVYNLPDAGKRCGRWSGLSCEAFFFPALPKNLEARFPLVDRVSVDGIIVNRYESNEPVRLTKRQILGPKAEKSAFVLIPDPDDFDR